MEYAAYAQNRLGHLMWENDQNELGRKFGTKTMQEFGSISSGTHLELLVCSGCAKRTLYIAGVPHEGKLSWVP